MTVRTLIVEDEPPAYRRLTSLLQAGHPDVDVVDVVDSIEGALAWFAANPPPALIISDIQLSDGRSFEIYSRLPPPCPIIFTTAYDAYMLDAFRTAGIGYLLKPVEEEELARALDKFRSLTRGAHGHATDIAPLLEALQGSRPRHRDRFLLKLGSKLHSVATADVAYFLSTDGSTTMHTRNGSRHLMDQPLDEIEAQLDPQLFHRINRQCLACVLSIGVVHQHFNGKLKVELRPAAPVEVMVSRERARAFKDWLDGIR
jgi:DNA-binding LytR/AlgR family response regulator